MFRPRELTADGKLEECDMPTPTAPAANCTRSGAGGKAEKAAGSRLDAEAVAAADDDADTDAGAAGAAEEGSGGDGTAPCGAQGSAASAAEGGGSAGDGCKKVMEEIAGRAEPPRALASERNSSTS